MITDFINYIIRSGLSLFILYLFYRFFLSNENMYRFNRLYLLFSLLFSFITPLIAYPGFISDAFFADSFNLTKFQDNYYQIRTLSMQNGESINLQLYILVIYSLISLILLVSFTFNLLRFRKVNKDFSSVKVKGYRILLMDRKVLPHSFFSTVYLNEKDYLNGKIPSELLDHEFRFIYPGGQVPIKCIKYGL